MGESNSPRPFSLARMILMTAFILTVSSARVVLGSGECFNVTITTKLYGHENAWSLGTCVSDDGRYRENNVYTEECCLDAGTYTLNCDDTYKDGWHGGFIEIKERNIARTSPRVINNHRISTLYIQSTEDGENSVIGRNVQFLVEVENKKESVHATPLLQRMAAMTAQLTDQVVLKPENVTKISVQFTS